MTMRGSHGRDAYDGTDSGTDSGVDALSGTPVTLAAGMKGTVLEARSDGSCLAEFAFAPQTADSDGDFVQGILTRDQYEVIES